MLVPVTTCRSIEYTPPQKIPRSESPAVTCRLNRDSPTTPSPSTLRPFKKALQSSSKSNDIHEVRSVPIPNCPVLANCIDYSDKEIDNATIKLVRKSMDSLIAICEGRPTELKIRLLAKSICT